MKDLAIKYVNLTDFGTEDTKLPLDDNSVDSCLSLNLLEKFPYSKGYDVLREYFRIVAPNGYVDIWVTNFDRIMYDIAEERVRHDLMLKKANRLIYSNASVYTPHMVNQMLHKVGFKRVETLHTQQFNEYSFGLRAYKEGSNSEVPDLGY